MHKSIHFKDYPRLCGKYRINIDNVDSNLGSSPPMREIPRFFSQCLNHFRIIPAYAGNTLKDPSMTLPTT